MRDSCLDANKVRHPLCTPKKKSPNVGFAQVNTIRQAKAHLYVCGSPFHLRAMALFIDLLPQTPLHRHQYQCIATPLFPVLLSRSRSKPISGGRTVILRVADSDLAGFQGRFGS